MRTFGRVLAAMGVVLAGVGGIGAVAMLPPPVRDGAVANLEEWRQAVRAYLPDIPELGSLIAGTSEDACAEPEAGKLVAGDEPDITADAGADPAADCVEGKLEVGVLRGGNAPASPGGNARFLAPAAAATTPD